MANVGFRTRTGTTHHVQELERPGLAVLDALAFALALRASQVTPNSASGQPTEVVIYSRP